MTNSSVASGNYLLGFDVGSSSVKAALLDTETGKIIGSAVSPAQEMEMIAHKPGWAEQAPEDWWKYVTITSKTLIKEYSIDPADIAAIGISYQMHGLVAVDENRQVVRPSIIWCDSRAAEIGSNAFEQLGSKYCLTRYLNSPGNFTASKLKWVKENEPELYKIIYKVMLPGDYISMKMTGEIGTTVSGLSEGILWDYEQQGLADSLLEFYGIDERLIPNTYLSFDMHGKLTPEAAEEIGLKQGIQVSYKAGDQPNNAFSLNVLEPGEAAATAGTSGVIYGVTGDNAFDPKSRVNTFVHVNHNSGKPRNGVLLCVNGTGIMNSWLRKTLGTEKKPDYDQLNKLASKAPIGADGVTILPFGNGAERIFENRDLGASVKKLNFNRHETAHLLRAAQEGIVFALNYGFEIMGAMNMQFNTVKAGHTNMFLSPLFREAFVNTTGLTLEMYNTDGALGAARGAGYGAGVYTTYEETFSGLELIDRIEPDSVIRAAYQESYQNWYTLLQFELNN